MPRRKSGKPKGGPSKPKRPSKGAASIKKWNTVDDILMDEVDQFHANRDKILVEGGDDDYLDGDDEDEVFALKGMDEGDSDEEEEELGGYVDEDEEMEDIPEKPKAKGKGKKKKGKEEAMSEEEEEEEQEEESWGRGKAAYYNSNADELESDDEEGHELEEQEAKRLQAKSREHMHDDDFGLKDIIEIQKDDIDLLDEPAVVVTEPLPTEPQDIIRHLEKTNPEALALVRDWEDTAAQLAHTEQKIKEVEAADPDTMSLGMLHLHYQTLLSYTTVLAFYIHLRAMPKYAQRPSLLQSHPIMKRLLTLKQALITMEDLNFTMSDDEDEDDEDDDSVSSGDIDAVEMKWDDIMADGEQLWGKAKKRGLEEDELAELLREAEAAYLSAKPSKSKTKEKKSKEPPKKKRKVQNGNLEPPKPVFDLEEPEFVSSKKSSSRPSMEDDSYGEAQYLQHADAEDKATRKKTLQFHTARIESASARRQTARNQAIGGDDDIPYRERQKEKAARLEIQARKRVAEQGGADLDGVEPEMPSNKRRLEDDEDGSDGGDSPDEYYELVKKRTKERKEKKKAEHDAERESTKVHIAEDDAAGPRSLTRAILKNKGLTPHRPKSVRNPRVKKRQKYEQAKKKHASQKAVYKGGVSETKGRYDGERSGISKVVKSVRLG